MEALGRVWHEATSMNTDMKNFYATHIADPSYEGIRGDALLLNDVDLKGKTVLDIGCGGGFDAKTAALKGALVTAIDVQDRMIEFARQNNSHESIMYILGDFMEENFEQFDFVYMNWSAFHFKDKKEVFEKVYQLLKIRGQFMVSDTWLYKPEELCGEWYFEPKENYMTILQKVFGNAEYLGEKKQSNVFYRINFRAVK